MNTKTGRTALGILAILFWSTAFAFARDLSEQVGIFRSSALFCIGGGILGCFFILRSKENRREVLSLPFSYLIICGGLFVINNVSFYLALGLAETRQNVIEVGLINYLWPSLNFFFAVVILKYKGRLLLLPGIMLATAGVILASIPVGNISTEYFLFNFRSNLIPYMLAFVAAISWALYSNISRKLGKETSSFAIPIFILTTGLILFILSFLYPEKSVWNVRVFGELVYMAIIPTFLGFLFWDMAMTKGDLVLVTSFVYFNPLLVTLFSAVFLGVALSWNLWIACLFVILGSAICKYSVQERFQVA